MRSEEPPERRSKKRQRQAMAGLWRLTAGDGQSTAVDQRKVLLEGVTKQDERSSNWSMPEVRHETVFPGQN